LSYVVEGADVKHTNIKLFAVVLAHVFLTSPLVFRGDAIVSSATLAPTLNSCINLEFEQDGVLPSSQGFTYSASPGVSETSVYSVAGGMLHLNTLGTGAAAFYQLPGAYDPSQDFALEIRMKVYPETGFFGMDFEVSDNVTDFEFGVDASGIRLPPPPNSRPFLPFDPTDGFHTYRVFSPGGTRAYHFFIDGVLVASNSVSGGDPGGSLLFGDGTASGGDGRADIEYIRYCQSALVCVSPPSGMVSWWPGDGNANDIVGGNPGSLVAGAAFAPGFVEQAFSFDGVDDSVSVEDSPSLRLSQFTLSAWINPAGLAPGQGIITKAQASGNWVSYMIRLLDGRVNLVVENRAENRSGHWQTPSVVTPNTWFHVAGTWQNLNGDVTDAKIYVNGFEQPLDMYLNLGYGPTFTPGYSVEALFIGKQEVPNEGYFAGLIDEADVYDRVLSAAEVLAIFNAGSAGKCKSVTVPQLSELGTANVWLGLKNSDDVGTKFDLLAEVLKNGAVVGSGQLDAVTGGSSGFNNAVLRTIILALSSPVSCGSGDTLSIRLSVRIALGVSGHRSGTARLWLNDAAANSRFGATIAGATSEFFLRDAFALSTSAGAGPKKTIDVFVDRLVGGNPFKPFGTWSKTL
jgi:concanavalin A-like lectin/glucanase superfamily protein